MTALPDRLEISDVVASLAHAQDDKDWERFRELFADRVVLDASSHLGSEPVELTADELTALAQGVIDGFPFTHHLTSNLLIEVQGDRASCRNHTWAYHYFPTDGIDYCLMRGAWELSLRRESGRWLIEKWAVVRAVPLEGDEGLYERAADAAREKRES
jgi:3-phenylpropionate/cinnamic acid dioxygenase small subunit